MASSFIASRRSRPQAERGLQRDRRRRRTAAAGRDERARERSPRSSILRRTLRRRRRDTTCSPTEPRRSAAIRPSSTPPDAPGQRRTRLTCGRSFAPLSMPTTTSSRTSQGRSPNCGSASQSRGRAGGSALYSPYHWQRRHQSQGRDRHRGRQDRSCAAQRLRRAQDDAHGSPEIHRPSATDESAMKNAK